MNKLLCRFLLYWIASMTICWCFHATADMLYAQQRDTVRVDATRSDIASSRILLWQGVRYRWTVSGRGSVGQLLGQRAEIDARFILTNLNIPLVSFPAKLPLTSNGTAAEQYCASITSSGTSLQTLSPCNAFLATNAIPQAGTDAGSRTKTLDRFFTAVASMSSAEQLRRYAFEPENDVYLPNNIYTAIVQGANTQAQCLFVDNLTFPRASSQAAYADNQTNGEPTRFTVAIERISPELVLWNGNRTTSPNWNDANPARLLRDTTIDFGSTFTDGRLSSTTVFLTNRGLETLRIDSIRIVDSTGAALPPTNFQLIVTDGQGATNRLVNRQTDTIPLIITFRATDVVRRSAELRIFTNDPTHRMDSAGRGMFVVRLQGNGATGAISVIGEINFEDTFVGSERGRQFTITRNTINNVFSFDARLRLGPQSPFVLADSTFSVNWTESSRAEANLSMLFQPRQIGVFVDSVIFRGANLIDTKMYLRGRGIKADAVIEPDTATVDFGTLVSGMTVSQLVRVRNTGNLPLVINIEPLFGATNEFRLPTQAILPETTGAVWSDSIIFRATPDIVSGRKLAIIRINVTFGGNTVVQRIISLTAVRLPNVLTVSTNTVQLGSVYVNSTSTNTLVLQNTAPFALAAVAVDTAFVSGSQELNIDTQTALPRIIATGSTITLPVRYLPRNRGADNAQFTLRYRLANGAAETISIALQGTGVEQQINVVAVRPDLPDPRFLDRVLRGTAGTLQVIQSQDTVELIELAPVRLGDTKTLTLTLRNNGNIPYRAVQQPAFRVITGDQVFQILNHFPQTLLPVNAEQTMRLSFRPQRRGTHILEYTITSDIVQRIPTAPSSAEQKVFYVRGTGVIPQIQTDDLVQFDDVTLGSTCTSSNIRIAEIRNIGGAVLNIQRVQISTPAGSPPNVFRLLSGTSPFNVLPGGRDSTIRIAFVPTLRGDFAAELLLTTDSDGLTTTATTTTRIVLRGRAVQQPAVNVGIQDTLRARPGTRLSIPISVRSTTGTAALSLTNTAEFRLTFDQTLLRYVNDVITLGTASEGATVTSATTQSGDVVVRVTMPPQTRFREQPILVNLVFDTYLGRKAATEIAVSGLRFGDNFCAERISVAAVRNGAFLLDSVCGLNVKTLPGTALNFQLVEVAPNPITHDGVITFAVAFPTHVRLWLYNAQGERKAVLAEGLYPEGVYEARIPMEELGSGVYFYEMQAGIFRQIRKVLIAK